MQNASLSRLDKSLAMVSAQRSSGVAAAASQMRRLFAPMGASVRHEVLMAAENEDKFQAPSDVRDFDGRAASRKAEKSLFKEEKWVRNGKGGGKAIGDGEKR